MAMADDWRLEVGLFEHGRAHALTERLAAGKLSDDLEEAFGKRLVVSADPPNVFVYTGDREQAEAAEARIREVAAQHNWDIEIQLRHWHLIVEEWEDLDNPLPRPTWSKPLSIASCSFMSKKTWSFAAIPNTR